ncbi:MAG: DUF4097 family beta strand repeat protein [Acidobacteria bacterium]|nr:DUF4097 family beta strand repeat protein [Acidobacteriota bacterium]
MKRWIIAVLLISVAAAAGMFRGTSGKFSANNNAVATSEVREEIRQTYQLSPGANVEVRGINGQVEIETADTTTAEVYILRTAANQTDLETRKVTVTATATSLVIQGENQRGGFWQNLWHGDVKHRVVLKVPRQIALTIKGVNGPIRAGEVTGAVQISGVNGKVETAQTDGYSEISGVNGSVTVAIRQIGEKGLRIKGINGAVELRFADKLNADIEARGINGRVKAELPDVVLQGEQERSKFNARIGTGGAPVNVSGVNGSVRLVRAASSASE